MTMQNLAALRQYAERQVRRNQALAAEQAQLIREFSARQPNGHDTVTLHRYCAGRIDLARRWAGVERRAS